MVCQVSRKLLVLFYHFYYLVIIFLFDLVHCTTLYLLTEYYSLCHIFVIVQALNRAALRIVQLAFANKPLCFSLVQATKSS